MPDDHPPPDALRPEHGSQRRASRWPGWRNRRRRCRRSCSTTRKAAGCSTDHRTAGILPDAHRAWRCCPRWRRAVAATCWSVRRCWWNTARATRPRPEFLLDRQRGAVPVFAAYVPIDVAAPSLGPMRARLRPRPPGAGGLAVAGRFPRPPWRCRTEIGGLPRLGFFPGSTIGNLDPDEARALPAPRAQRRSAPGRGFLVGVDLRKDRGDPAARLRRCRRA